MLQSKTNKSGKWWLTVKTGLAILALWFIYLKVVRHENSRDYLEQLQTVFAKPASALLFLLVFVLMFVNWTIEAYKWKYMIRKIEAVSTRRSLEAVFSGITISFFTPNRIGEYAGRVFHLQPGIRMQATLVTVIENSSQLLVTLLTGSIASMIYLGDYFQFNPWILMLVRVLFVLLCLVCLLLYFNIDLFERLFRRFGVNEYRRQILHVFALYSTRELFHVFLLSLARYFVFSLQFFLLLRLYGSYFGLAEGILMIAMTFFAMSIVPTFTFAELGIRGAVSAYFFGKLTIDVLPVLNASFSLWLVNLVLPALAGAIFIFHFRLGKNES
jgi:hypothetical protein